MSHTKRKLKAYKSSVLLDGDYNGIFCICQDYVESESDVCAEANAAEFVHRWNCHDVLLAACEKIEPFLSQLAREYPDLHPREEHIKITQAIAEAKK